MAIVAWSNGKPDKCPKCIRTPWPNISYTDTFGCNARVTVQQRIVSQYFGYWEHGGVIKAHKAARAWVKEIKSKARCTMGVQGGRGRYRTTTTEVRDTQSGIGGVYLIERYNRSGFACWSYSVGVGTKRKEFFLGTENTWTQARDDRQREAAIKYRTLLESQLVPATTLVARSHSD